MLLVQHVDISGSYQIIAKLCTSKSVKVIKVSPTTDSYSKCNTELEVKLSHHFNMVKTGNYCLRCMPLLPSGSKHVKSGSSGKFRQKGCADPLKHVKGLYPRRK